MTPTRMLLPALCALALAAPAWATPWQTDADASTLGFTASAQGESFQGRFAQFDARIVFDPAALADARFDVAIDLASADTANAERDETLHGADFFRSAREPQARYTATRFRELGGGRFAAEGELELRGMRAPVTLEFSWQPGDPAVLEGRAELDRLDFGVGAGEWADPGTIAREVIVVTRLELRATP